jgi:hypothetical protein
MPAASMPPDWAKDLPDADDLDVQDDLDTQAAAAEYGKEMPVDGDDSEHGAEPPPEASEPADLEQSEKEALVVARVPPRPFCRTLKVGMGGPDVAAYQLALHNFTTKNPKSKLRPYGISPDPLHHFGFFGAPMAAQVERLRKLHNENHPKDIIDPSGGMIGPRMHVVLAALMGPDASSLLREEYDKLHPQMTAREFVVGVFRDWYAHHKGESVYSGPGHSTVGLRWDGISHHRPAGDYPRFADCSSGYEWALWLGQLKFGPNVVEDPSRNGWAWGSTLSMAPHGVARSASTAEPGDAFFFGRSAWNTTHVAMMVERINGVPWTIGFGSQGGPWLLPYRYRHDLVLVRSYIH